MHDDTDPDDDWAPLPAEQLVVRPGEVEAPAPPPAKMPRPAPPRPRRRPTPEGERAFAELQQRLLAMPPSDSIVAEMQRREQREARRRDGRARAGEQLASTVVAVEQVAEAPAALEFDERNSELDPRELEAWFQELPESERERLRAAWSEERHRYDWTSGAAKKRVVRGAVYGAGFFFCLGVLMLFLTGALAHVPFYVLAGGAAGAIATLCGGGRFAFAASGALAFAAIEGENLLAVPFMLYGLLLAIAGMSMIGLDGELRRSAGCRDD
ncbi:MAG: hypothetical protein R3F29_14295 [Planctomycetota bacterium]